MTDILFKCKSCSHQIVIDEAGAGQTFACPKCRAAITVPAADTRLDCPHCSAPLCVTTEFIGESFDCPMCENTVNLGEDDESVAERQSDLAEVVAGAGQSVPPPLPPRVPESSPPRHPDDEKSSTARECETAQGESEDAISDDKPEILAKCPRCEREDIPFVCPNCEKSTGGMQLKEGRVECFCGIETDRISCPDCGATIVSKWFRRNPAKTQPKQDAPQHCPRCKAALGEGDVLCVCCGWDSRTGEKIGSTSFGKGASSQSGRLPCSQCGRLIPKKVWSEQRGKCGMCMAPRDESQAPPKMQPPQSCDKQTPSEADHAAAKPCPICKSLLEKDAAFCVKCGWSSRTEKLLRASAEKSTDSRQPRKVRCKNCDAMILSETAKRTGGYCMPCSRNTPQPPQMLQKNGVFSPFSISIAGAVLLLMLATGQLDGCRDTSGGSSSSSVEQTSRGDIEISCPSCGNHIHTYTTCANCKAMHAFEHYVYPYCGNCDSFFKGDYYCAKCLTTVKGSDKRHVRIVDP